MLGVLDTVGVDGTFVFVFAAPVLPHRPDDPPHDLDIAGYSLVETFPPGSHGLAYPDLAREPKQSFYAVADLSHNLKCRCGHR